MEISRTGTDEELLLFVDSNGQSEEIYFQSIDTYELISLSEDAKKWREYGEGDISANKAILLDLFLKEDLQCLKDHLEKLGAYASFNNLPYKIKEAFKRCEKFIEILEKSNKYDKAIKEDEIVLKKEEFYRIRSNSNMYESVLNFFSLKNEEALYEALSANTETMDNIKKPELNKQPQEQNPDMSAHYLMQVIEQLIEKI